MAPWRKPLTGSLALLFEASDSGKGMRWTHEGGHPWMKGVVVGYADGSSCRRVYLESDGRLLNSDTSADLCAPAPGKNGWPQSASLAPATQVNPGYQPPPLSFSEKYGEYIPYLPLFLLSGVCLISGALLVFDQKRRNIYTPVFTIGIILLLAWLLIGPVFTKVI